MAAPVPELTSRTMSMEGIRAKIASANSTLALGWRPKRKPSSTARCTASTTAGWPVTQDHGAPRADVINVTLTIGVPKYAPWALHKAWGAAPAKRRTGSSLRRE